MPHPDAPSQIASSQVAPSHVAPSHVERVSAGPFAPTLARIETAIESAGLTIFARIDHAALARSVGLDMPPTIVVIYGNPRGGTPIMQAAPAAALDLPLRVLVREDASGQTFVSFHPIGPTLRDAGVSEALAGRLDPAQGLILKTLQAAEGV